MNHREAERCLAEVYDRYADSIFRHCYYRVRDRERAKDLAQDAFLKTWRFLINGGEVANIKAFLYRTATNLTVDESRKHTTESLEEMNEQSGFDPSAPDERLPARLDGAAAMRLVRELDERSRAVVLMRYADDMPVKEIAALTGETENAVSVRLHRARQRLRTMLI